MTPRSIRRAAERRAEKLARKAARNQALSGLPATPAALPDFEPPAPRPRPATTPARLAANRANAELSTGPRTPKGKARSSVNALTSALTGRTVLLPSDDVAQYEALILQHQRQYHPANPIECLLVQSIVDCLWRQARATRIEMAIFAQGRDEFEALAVDVPESQRAEFLDKLTVRHYEKDLRNLHIQENRLGRRRDKEIAELERLQADRLQRERAELEMAAKVYLAAKNDNQPFHPEDHGFECSTSDVERFLANLRASRIAAQSINQKQQHDRKGVATA